MKRIGVLAAVSLLVLFLCTPVQAAPTMGTWNSDDGYFAAGDWRELLWGVWEGQVGNEIQAASVSFDLPTAYLFEGAYLFDVQLQPAEDPPRGYDVYATVYKGGTLKLVNTADNPWFNEDDEAGEFEVLLGDTIVTTNKYPDGTMSFELESTGIFIGSVVYDVQVKARFDQGVVEVVPEDGETPAMIQGDLSWAEITISAPPLAVDVKPCSCPNPLNLRSNGVLPVAILGSGGLDVMAIDPETVTLAVVACNGEPVVPVEPPAEGEEEPPVPLEIQALRYAYEDVATPLEEGAECVVCGPDGYMDLTLKFKRQAIITEILRLCGEVQRNDVITLSVSAALLDGTVIQGEDDVIIKGKPKMKQAKLKKGKTNQNKNKNKNK